ncbi:unnamed protein product [Wickerhamomyces anomalus]
MSKTRYYLEQSVPELEDLQKKGSKSRDYLKYVEFEMNLEKLRKKRYNRLNSAGLINTKPSISDWASERRILFIFDRSIKKFPNDFKLWDNYLQFAKGQKLYKKIYKIYNQLLQLHPTSIKSWINAAEFEFENIGSAKNARILFQKGLRFNKDSKKLWLSYTIFELSYITKLLNRRKLLGLVTEKQQLEHEHSELVAQDEDDDLIKLPTISNEELKSELNNLPDADLNMLGNPETNPALKGDVALTIFDVCINTLFGLKKSTIQSEFEFKYELSVEFLSIFKKFKDLNRFYLSSHIIQYLLSQFPNSNKVIILDIVAQLEFEEIGNESFINSLQSATMKYLAYKEKINNDNDKSELKTSYSSYLLTNFLQSDDETDEQTRQILHSIIKKL